MSPLIHQDDFVDAAARVLDKDLRRNQNQKQAVLASLPLFLFVVAGAGSGKTTVLALKVLKLIFVDQVDPGAIMATTFTKKAARELRSRILGWGDALRGEFLLQATGNAALTQWLQSLDLNRVLTGTLDSIAEQVLREYRAPNTQPPVPVDEFVAKGLLTRKLVLPNRLWEQAELCDYVGQLTDDPRGLGPAQIAAKIMDIRDRFIHDQVDVAAFKADADTLHGPHPGKVMLCDLIDQFDQLLRDRLLLDFAALEREFLMRLQNGTLQRFMETLLVVLIDEYQDTNLLQESIYVELARTVQMRGGSLSVVGDDDQALYRFRGATVELFRDYLTRQQAASGAPVSTIYLSDNYRSTARIVDFAQDFVKLDPAFQPKRVAAKPRLVASRKPGYTNFPVMGMFRDTPEELAEDLAAFIEAVRGSGYTLPNGSGTIQLNPAGGSLSDIALLCSTPQEWNSTGQKKRLPLLLREELAAHNLGVFNPRGRPLRDVEDLQRLCGLLLLCLDGQSNVQNALTTLPQDAVRTIDRWRAVAQTFIATSPSPRTRSAVTLVGYVERWQQRRPLNHGSWPDEFSVIELIYQLLAWLPDLQDDPEGVVYLEAVMRTLNEAENFTSYRGQVIFDGANKELASIKELYWNVFVPLASGVIDLNEELLEAFPKDRLVIPSIHQVKGLEFPVTIVDVGSDFKTNHAKQRFRRFPDSGGYTGNVEEALRPFSPLGPVSASGRDRAFDDLIRLYYVAFSRPQDVLLLVGLTPNRTKNTIPNVATGWDRASNWNWGRGLSNLIHI